MMRGIKKIHFVGIGGIGMSGIAQVLLNLGYRVTGSDLKPTELTRRLVRAGAKVFRGHRGTNIRGADVVVTSTAVPSSNPELRAAKRAGIPVVPRVEMLAEIARLKKTVTVSGTHGKTTTSAMTAMALQAAGVDPTLVVGGQITNLKTNARLGLGDYLVAEADESDGSFLRLSPLVAVVTNIDTDHLDYYGSFAKLKAAFRRHLESLPFYGTAVLCSDDPVLRAMSRRLDRPVIRYGLKSGADWRGKIISRRPPVKVVIFRRGRRFGVLRLRLAGRHNVQNALAALAVCEALNLDLKKALKGLEEFRGVGRRMDPLGEASGISFIDDYGHHPTEVRATLEAVRDLYPKRRIVALFQPHRFSRTKTLHRQFGPALKGADVLHVLDIYPAGERPSRGVTSALVVRAAKRAGVDAHPFTRAVDLIRELRPGDVVLTLGAGDVWKTGIDLLRRLRARTLSIL